jgi:1,4-alpha-glucan branching enzyme
VRLEQALAGASQPLSRVAAGVLPTTTWGTPRTLSTWDGPQVAELAWQARDAELRTLLRIDRTGPQAQRELLLLQSSDWAFQVTNDLAGPYPRERATGHRAALEAALGAR